jgi:tetrahydromethanopterin S-methyltransferase subunit H
MNFKKEQKTLNICGIKLGGKIGENPTVLIGSIFNKGDKLVINEKSGIFNKKEAENLIFFQKELADQSGNPCMLDIVGTHEFALQKYIDFVTGLNIDPFLLNVPSVEIRIRLLKYLEDIGLINRLVYNSINYTLVENEMKALQMYKVKSALIQSLNPSNPKITGMLEILNGKKEYDGLLNKSIKAGIENTLLFSNVFEVPTIGIASMGIYSLKEKFGFPTGTAPVGIIGSWCLKNKTFKGDFKKACEVTGVTLAQSMGADFIIYGSLKKAEYIFPAVAIVDAMISLNSRITFSNRKISKNHPLYRLYFPLT